MKKLFAIVLFVPVCALAVCAQDSSNQLPSAPSAVAAGNDQQETPPPPPPKKAEDGKKKDEPIFQNLTPPTPLPPAQPEEKPAQKEVSNPATASPAQQSDASDAEADIGPRISVASNEVNLVFTVTDKHGNFMKGLTRNDFKVLDNANPVEKLTSFSAQTDLPLRVGLLIDTSTSIRERFKFEQEAAIEFLNQILRPKEDQAFVMSFDSTTNLEVPFTNRAERLADAVRGVRPSGGTAFFDAIYQAARDVVLKHPEKTVVRRALIILSDGQDNVSHVTREEAIEMAQRAELIIYCISTNQSPTIGMTKEAHEGEKVLERIAEATGGRAFHPFQAEDVANAFSDIQAELRSQYSISYRPVNMVANGGYRTIEVDSPNRKLRIRARKGYFAPKR